MSHAGHLAMTSVLDDMTNTFSEDHIDLNPKVYCNRNLNLQKIEAIGFDMDYTLARYKQDALDALSVKLTLERLDECGYPQRYWTSIIPDFSRSLVRYRRQRAQA